MKRLLALIAAALMMAPTVCHADEGMWIPMLLGRNQAAMQKAGMHITAQDIYDINKASLKDAVLLFGGGCTGEFVSDEGLVLTNHHCGYSYIVKHSTVEHDYLTNGFWAMTREQEIPCPGLTVTRLVYMQDVTKEVLDGVTEGMSEGDRETTIENNIKAVSAKATEGTHYKAVIKPFYYGNQYFMYVNEVFTDVRLVGAPPSNIGKFGGDTDNWMWPRHTGDFSMFRVYVDGSNKPAAYSKDNVPYRPLKHLEISLKGVDEGDFTFVFGYPGTTRRYVTHDYVDLAANQENPVRIALRTIRLDHYNAAMRQSAAQRLKYASRVASIANGWKKWQGEELAFKNLNIIGREKQKERDFMTWVNQKSQRVEEYGSALGKIEQAVKASAEAEKAVTLISEAPYRIELVGLAGRLTQAVSRQGEKPEVLDQIKGAYRDYVPELDRKEAVALLTFFRDRADREDYLKSLGVDFDDFATMDIPAYVDYLFDESAFTSYGKIDALVKAGDWEKVWADPAVRLFNSIMTEVMERYPAMLSGEDDIASGSKAFTKGLLEWEKGKPSYPDANSTMRLTYGHVLPYSPKDAVLYKHYSTVKGILEKHDPKNPEFLVPSKLEALIVTKDFGRYADPSDGLVHTCFLTNNDITGGNSGSPVLNAKGELIGLAFDGNWESMSSDVMFEPDLQRCICVDIRYGLFLVEKLGGATNIIKELDFAK